MLAVESSASRRWMFFRLQPEPWLSFAERSPDVDPAAGACPRRPRSACPRPPARRPHACRGRTDPLRARARRSVPPRRPRILYLFDIRSHGLPFAAGHSSGDQLRRLHRLGPLTGNDDRSCIRDDPTSHRRPADTGRFTRPLMANNLASLMFRAMYRFGFKPWDSGIPPPELKELIEGSQARAPGKALDLGCGTGTNTMYMAQHGWDVTGIDFVSTAIEAARKKVQAANVTPRLIQGDVTRLKELSIGVGYSLVFDLGCLHSIPEARRDAYAAGVNEVTVPGADFLVWGFYAKPNFFVNAKLAQNELEERFGRSWDMVRAWGGEQPDRFPGRWYHLRRRS